MGNEYGVSPFMILDVLGPMFIIGPLLIWLVVIGPLLVYPLARWKATRDGIADPQLGLKVALHYFSLIAFQLALFAGAIIVYAVLSKMESKGAIYRVGFGLLIPAGAVLGAHVVMLRRTNQDFFTGVRRLFMGYNLIVTGLVGFVALLFAFQVFFKKGTAGDEGRLAIASCLIYVGAWAACGIQFGRLVLDDHTSAAPPSNVVPPSAPTPAASQQSGPTLPSLSAGTYPPIDPKS